MVTVLVKSFNSKPITAAASFGKIDMNLRNLTLLIWAIDQGGLTRVFALTVIVVFIGFAVIFFLSLTGGPSEIIRHLQTP